jgi:FtsZ-interacting cell division protein ZipA
MSSLQTVLLIAGVVLVLAVLIYNAMQMRAVKSRLSASIRRETVRETAREAAQKTALPRSDEAPREPTLRVDPPSPSAPKEAPDFMAEAVLTLQLPDTTDVSPELAQQMLKTPGKRVRLFWQPQGASNWTLLQNTANILAFLGGSASDESATAQPDDTQPAPVHSLAFCLQLADRAQAVTPEQLDAFQKHVEVVASLLSASYTPFDVALEAERAKALDKACAQLDLQIGLTLHGKVGPLPGQQLLQAAQKLGLALERGALRYQREGYEMFRIESHDGSALSDERLRKAIQDPVLLLDVPQVRRPEQSFDEMLKLATQLAQALSAQLVDDRHRPVNDQGLALIRTEIGKATQALRDIGIDPGSPRALRLFTA